MTQETQIYQLKITLSEIKPEIWRRVLLLGDMTLGDLHEVIQAVMVGWQDCHLHQFRIGNTDYSVAELREPEYDCLDVEDEEGVNIEDVAKTKGDSFIYQYDFGDCWNHEIKAEKISPPENDKEYMICIGGERACPPEDCGGTQGYEQLLEALGDSNHGHHQELKQWSAWITGESFDPEEFSIEKANERLFEI